MSNINELKKALSPYFEFVKEPEHSLKMVSEYQLKYDMKSSSFVENYTMYVEGLTEQVSLGKQREVCLSILKDFKKWNRYLRNLRSLNYSLDDLDDNYIKQKFTQVNTFEEVGDEIPNFLFLYVCI